MSKKNIFSFEILIARKLAKNLITHLYIIRKQFNAKNLNKKTIVNQKNGQFICGQVVTFLHNFFALYLHQGQYIYLFGEARGEGFEMKQQKTKIPSLRFLWDLKKKTNAKKKKQTPSDPEN